MNDVVSMSQYEMFSKFKYSDLLDEIKKFYVSEIGEHADKRLETAKDIAEKLYSQPHEIKDTKSLRCIYQAIVVLESEMSSKEGLCKKRMSYRYFQDRGGCDKGNVKSAAEMIRSKLDNFDGWRNEYEKASREFHKNVRNEITSFYYLHGDQLLKPALGDKEAYVIAIMKAAYMFAEHLDKGTMPDVDAGSIALAAAAEATRYMSEMEVMVERGRRIQVKKRFPFLKQIKDFSVFTNDEGKKYSETEKLYEIQGALSQKIADIGGDGEFQKIMAFMDQIQINYLKDLADFRFFIKDLEEEKGEANLADYNNDNQIISEHVIQGLNSKYHMIERSNKGQRLPRFTE